MARDDDFESFIDHSKARTKEGLDWGRRKEGRKECREKKGEAIPRRFRGWRLSFKSVGNYSTSATWTRFGSSLRARKWPRMNILLSQSHASLQDNEFIRDRDISRRGISIYRGFFPRSIFLIEIEIETTGLRSRKVPFHKLFTAWKLNRKKKLIEKFRKILFSFPRYCFIFSFFFIFERSKFPF